MHQKFCIGACAAIAIALAATLAAQTSTASQTRSSASSADKVTLTGCLARASETAATTPDTIKFILTNVTPASSSSSASTTTAGGATTGTSGMSSRTATTYRLDADESKLTPHVGHKISVEGTVEPATGSSRPPATTTTPPGSSSGASNAPKLKVDSVTMVSATCP